MVCIAIITINSSASESSYSGTKCGNCREGGECYKGG